MEACLELQPSLDFAARSFCSSPIERTKLSAGVEAGIDQAVQPEAVLEGEQHGAALRGIGEADPGQDLGDQGAARAQALGELRAAALGAGGEQDQLDMQQRRAAQRIAPVALRGAERGDEVLGRAMLRQKLAVVLRWSDRRDPPAWR